MCTLGCASRKSATAIAFSECLSILRARVFKLRWSRNASNGDCRRQNHKPNQFESAMVIDIRPIRLMA